MTRLQAMTVVLCLAIGVVAWAHVPAKADVSNQGALGTFGGITASPSYELLSAGGGAIVGESSSEHFRMKSRAWRVENKRVLPVEKPRIHFFHRNAFGDIIFYCRQSGVFFRGIYRTFAYLDPVHIFRIFCEQKPDRSDAGI